MKQSSEIFFNTAQEIRRKINCVFPMVELPAITPDLIFKSSNYFDLFFIPCEKFVTGNNFSENEVYQNRLLTARELSGELNTVLTQISRDEAALENLTAKSVAAVPVEAVRKIYGQPDEKTQGEITKIILRNILIIQEIKSIREELTDLFNGIGLTGMSRKNLKELNLADTYYKNCLGHVEYHTDQSPLLPKAKLICDRIDRLQMKVNIPALTFILFPELKMNEQTFTNKDLFSTLKTIYSHEPATC